MRVLDIFSGIGGFSLGLERAGMETVAFCEIEEYPRKVLEKHWPNIPIYKDIKELTGDRLEEDGITDIDVLCGGWPCQPFSSAGKRLGKEDDRYLWREVVRLICEIRPRWFIGENVDGFVGMELANSLSHLEAEGYICEPFIIPACAVGLNHRRDRVWIIAHREDVNDFPNMARLPYLPQLGGDSSSGGVFGASGKENLCDMVGDSHGVSNRLDRVRAIGNAVVPQIPELIGSAIMRIGAN